MVKILTGDFKGPKGDTGKTGPAGPQGPQGPQRNLGTINIADGSTTEGPTYTLSAPKGKELYDNLLQISNPNLLIDDDSQVWQKRNEFNVTGDRMYTTGRWIAYMDASDGYMPYTVTNSSRRMKVLPIAGGCKFLIFQHVELNNSIIRKILGKKLTLSVKIISSNIQEINTSATVLYDSSDKLSVPLARKTRTTSANKYTTMKMTFNAMSDTDLDDVKSLQVIFSSPGITSDVYMNYVKLEFGEIVIPLIPKPYAEELMLCQRYGGYMYADYTMNVASNPFFNMMSVPVDMRIDPTLTLKVAGTLTNITSEKITHASFTNQVRLSSSASATGVSKVYGREYWADAEIYQGGIDMVKVYVKVDSGSLITEVNSEIFMESIDGYTLINKDEGDCSTHVQGNYLESGLMDEQGRHNYRLLGGNTVLLAEKEKQELFPPIKPELLEQERFSAAILLELAKPKTGNVV